MKFSGLLNFSDTGHKRTMMAMIGAAQGPHELNIKPFKPRRKNEHNAYYFAAVVTAFQQYLHNQGDMVSKDYCHDEISKKCLGERPLIIAATGEQIGTVRLETHVLNTSEFSAYVDRAVAWLAGFGIVVPDKKLFEEGCAV